MRLLSELWGGVNRCDGQTFWSVDVHAGIAMTRLWTGSNFTKDGFFFQAAPAAGVIISKKISNVISLQCELNYDKVKSKREGVLPLYPGLVASLPVGNIYYANVTRSIVLDYISSAVLARFHFGNTSNMYVEAGPYFAYLFHSSSSTSGESAIYKNSDAKDIVMIDDTHPLPVQTINDKRTMRNEILPVNTGGCTSLGIILPFAKKHFSVSGRYTFGILNIHRRALPSVLYKTDQLSILLSYTL